MSKSNLTDEDRKEISSAAYDIATGNYLLRPRKLSERALIFMICELLHRKELTVVEQEIIDYYNASTDPRMSEYYNNKYLKDE